MSSMAFKDQVGAPAIPLTEEQIAGLARLGDMGHQLGLLLDGPLASPVSSLLTKGGEWYAHYDIPAIAQSIVEAADALNRAGWFALIRDHAEFIANSLEALEPLVRQWIASSEDWSVDKIRSDAVWLMEQLRRGRKISEFVSDKWSPELMGYAISGAEYVQKHELIPVLQELIELLARLHQAGMYEKLSRVVNYAGHLDEGLDIEQLAGEMIRNIPPNFISLLREVLGGTREAIDEIEAHKEDFGGYRGLMHLLKDRQVQKGIQIMATVPALFARNSRH